jgi:hypothetical protein
MDGLTPAQGTITSDAQAISTSATWNSAGTTFTHWKAVITDTASAAGSLAVQILGGAAGSTTLFSVSKGGTVVAGGSISATGNVIAGGTQNIGFSARSVLGSASDGVLTVSNSAVTGFTRLNGGGETSSFPGLARNGTRWEQVLADGTSGGALASSGAYITQGSATGLTISDQGSLQEQVYKVTVATTAFVCAAVTCDLTIGTLPANTWLMNVTASLGTTFACTATCTSSTLSFLLGKGAGAAEYLASFDADAATGIFGDADAEMGTLLTRAAAIQGGTFTAGSQAVVLRLTSGTGNIGTGAATNLSQGSLVVWVTTRRLP